MKQATRYLALFLAVLIGFSVCCTPAAAQAAAPFADSGAPDLAGGVVTGLRFERYFSSIQPATYLKGSLDELYEWLSLIEGSLDCYVSVGGDVYEASCTVVWNLAQLPLDKLGRYTLVGTLLPPEGCTFGENMRRSITCSIRIVDRFVITRLDNFIENQAAIVVWQGDETEDFSSLDNFDVFLRG